MKKILWMVMAFTLCIMSTAFAYSDASSADAQNVLNSIKEIRYNVEAGVNFKDYSSLVSKAIVDFNKYINKYPNTDRDPNFGTQVKTLLTDYDLARTVWDNAIHNDVEAVPGDILESLVNTRPPLKDKLPSFNYPHAHVFYEDVLHALWSIAADDEKSITQTQP